MALQSVNEVHGSGMSVSAVLQTIVAGRIQSSRVHEGNQYTTITCPAKNEFSMPSVVEVKSKRKLGEVNSLLAPTPCAVSGYIRLFTYPNKKTGEIMEGREANVYFEVTE